MKKRFLSTGILFMVLVAMLAAIGVGYGLWSKTLHLDGVVKTGSVNAEFSSACTDDNGFPDCPMGQDFEDDGLDPAETGADPKLRYDKDVGSCEAEASAATDTDADQDGIQGATVTIDNGYPSYHCTAWFGIKNTGTIPWRVQAIEQHMNVDHWYSCDPTGMTGWTFVPASTWYDYCGTSVDKHIDLDANHWDGDVIDWDLNVHVTKLQIGDQIHPDEHTGIDLDIHVKQGAAQNAGGTEIGDPDAYQVDHRIQVVQYNEYEAP